MKKMLLILACATLLVSGAVWVMGKSSGSRPDWDHGSVTAHTGVSTTNAAESGSGSNAEVATRAKNTEWSRFRGPNGTGVSNDQDIPVEWSDDKNLAWKAKLPGPGASSPVLTKDYVFVTAYSGYGEEKRNPGELANLKRHICCVDRKTGDMVWTKSINSEQREDPYSGMGVPEHGYATNTPVTDGEHVYAFLGKSGVVAFDMKGDEIWRVSVGTDSANRRWGSAASLILFNDMVIVNAAEESRALIALDKLTGETKWKSEAASLELCYSTPAIVEVDASRSDLVIAVPGEIWGLNPTNGNLVWYAETALAGNLSPSVIVDGTNVYAFGGYRSTGSLAVKSGGTGDVSGSNVLWTSRNTSYVASPVLLDGRLYWIDESGVYYCSQADSGELVHRSRVSEITGGGKPVYASPVAINGKIYVQTRTDGVLVLEPGDDLKIIAQNRFASDSSVFNATPAVDAGQLFLRSDQYLYCLENN